MTANFLYVRFSGRHFLRSVTFLYASNWKSY